MFIIIIYVLIKLLEDVETVQEKNKKYANNLLIL